MTIKLKMTFAVFAAVLMINCSDAQASELLSHDIAFDEDTVTAGQPCKGSDPVLPREGMIERRLDNGLKYVVMKSDSPSRMVECRIIFKAGSVYETDGNRGSAHFLEHMAFGGTRHFPDRRLVDYLESLGVQYGIGINAYTGYDRTIYMFSVPNDSPSNIDNALLILKDWLTDISVTHSKVEGEKGIILEELRSYDVGDSFYDLKIGNGIYSKGIPLGSADDISSMTPQKLRDFHRTWYTPDRATVAIVGDIEPEEVERKIISTFGKVPGRKSPQVPDYPLEYASGVTVGEVADTLLRRAEIEVMVPHRARMKSTLDDVVASERSRLLVRAVSRRLYDTGTSANVTNHWYLADKEHFVIQVSGEDKEAAAGNLSRTVAEICRLADEGFYEDELEDVKKGMGFRPAYLGSSAMICDEIVDAALFDDRLVTEPEQAEYVSGQLKATTSRQLQDILSEWLDAADESILFAYRYNPAKTEGFTGGEVANLWRNARHSKCPAYAYEKEPEAEECREPVPVPEYLVQERPFDENLIRYRTFYDNIKVTDVFLNNGMRFVLRPTEDESGRIMLQMFAPGGLSRVPEDEYAVYEGMAAYMELGGIEGLEDSTYHSLIAEHELGMLLAIESNWHGIIASAPASSTRLLLNMMYGKMNNPGLNYEEFDEIREGEIEGFGEESYLSKLMKLDVQRQLNMRIDSLMGNLTYGRRTAMTLKDLETMNLDKIAGQYRELYTNPDGMTCVVCGAFDVDEFIHESVPVFARMEKGREPQKMGKSHFVLPETTRHIEYPNQNETQTVFDYLRFGTYEPSLRSGLKLKLMNNLIRNRLLLVLREQESLVYSPYSSLYYTASPDRIFYIDINASVDRNNTARVHEVLDDIIRELQAKKVSDKELNTLKKIFIVNKRTSLEDDATAAWKNYLVSQMRNDETLAEIDMYEDVLESITAEELRNEFRRCFDTDRYMILSMGPF